MGEREKSEKDRQTPFSEPLDSGWARSQTIGSGLREGLQRGIRYARSAAIGLLHSVGNSNDDQYYIAAVNLRFGQGI
jgi:hypothetical protein